jgi:hypothetical protein
MFPGFAALPNRGRVDFDHYKEADGTYRPLRHWCFLGEITNSMRLPHLELELTDVDEKKVPLHFYTDDRGTESAPAIQKGYTVAVMYAQRSVFKYTAPGIRHDNPKMLKVRTASPYNQTLLGVLTYFNVTKTFPMPLKTLLELNDNVQQFSRIVDGIRTCHGCGTKAACLNRCARCALVWYCDSVRPLSVLP